MAALFWRFLPWPVRHIREMHITLAPFAYTIGYGRALDEKSGHKCIPFGWPEGEAVRKDNPSHNWFRRLFAEPGPVWCPSVVPSAS